MLCRYPGGPLFNPLGFQVDANKAGEMQWREIKNGERLISLLHAYVSWQNVAKRGKLQIKSDPCHPSIMLTVRLSARSLTCVAATLTIRRRAPRDGGGGGLLCASGRDEARAGGEFVGALGGSVAPHHHSNIVGTVGQ